MTIYEDPHAWLRPLYASVRTRNASRNSRYITSSICLSRPSGKSSPRAQRKCANGPMAPTSACLLHRAVAAERGTSDTVELWRVSKGDRVLMCRAKHMPEGVDLQLFEGDEFRRTQFSRIAPGARTLAATWLAALEASGWTLVAR